MFECRDIETTFQVLILLWVVWYLSNDKIGGIHQASPNAASAKQLLEMVPEVSPCDGDYSPEIHEACESGQYKLLINKECDAQMPYDSRKAVEKCEPNPESETEGELLAIESDAKTGDVPFNVKNDLLDCTNAGEKCLSVQLYQASNTKCTTGFSLWSDRTTNQTTETCSGLQEKSTEFPGQFLTFLKSAVYEAMKSCKTVNRKTEITLPNANVCYMDTDFKNFDTFSMKTIGQEFENVRCILNQAIAFTPNNYDLQGPVGHKGSTGNTGADRSKDYKYQGPTGDRGKDVKYKKRCCWAGSTCNNCPYGHEYAWNHECTWEGSNHCVGPK
jgi:hypothetical protein